MANDHKALFKNFYKFQKEQILNNLQSLISQVNTKGAMTENEKNEILSELTRLSEVAPELFMSFMQRIDILGKQQNRHAQRNSLA